MSALRRMLAEDNANDVELTLSALQVNRLANEVEVVRDGVQVPVDFGAFIEAVKAVGAFWAVVNEPPPSEQA